MCLQTSISKGEIEDRMHELCVCVRDQVKHSNFSPGFNWWQASSKKTLPEGHTPIWEQIGVTHGCFEEHFGHEWTTTAQFARTQKSICRE